MFRTLTVSVKVLYDITCLGRGLRYRRGMAGIHRVTDNLLRHLAQSEECELTVCSPMDLEVTKFCSDYIRSVPEVKHLRMAPAPLPAILASELAHLSHRIYFATGLRQVGLRCLRKPLHTLVRLLPPAQHPLRVRTIAKADILHILWPFGPLPVRCSQAPSVKVFVTVHDVIPMLFPHLAFDGARHLVEQSLATLKSCGWALCCSHATKNDLCNYLPSLPPDHVFVTHWAASPLFHPCTEAETMGHVRTKYRIPEGPYLLALSTLEPRKGLDHVIRCFSRLVTEQGIKDLNLVLAGQEGWKYEAIFQTHAAHAALHHRIIFTGYVADEDLAPLYSGALAFVYPSLYEGFGLPPLEAMQCGTPVVTSNTSSLPEVVGDAGIMVDPKDLDALCHAIFDLYRNPRKRGDLVQKSIQRARLFSWEKCARETVAAYKTALIE